MISSIAILCVPLLFSAFFSAAETAYTSLTALQIKLLRAKHPIRGKIITYLYSKQNILLGVILVGNNVSNLIFSVIATNLTLQIFGNAYLAYATGIMVFVLLIFGEITPKQLALRYNQQFVLMSTYPIWLFFILFFPFTYVLSLLTQILEKKLANSTQMSDISKDHIVKLLYQVRASNAIDPDYINQATRILNATTMPIDQIITHRKDIFSLPCYLNVQEAKQHITTNNVRYTNIPIYQNDDKEHIIGIINTCDLLRNTEEHKRISSLLLPPLFVTENKTIQEVVTIFRSSNNHFAIVLDEYGGMKGVVTFNDIAIYIVDIDKSNGETRTKPSFIRINQHQFIIDGTIETIDIAEKIGVPLEIDSESSTIGGYLQEITGSLPMVHQVVQTIFGDMQIAKIKNSRIISIIWTPAEGDIDI